MDWIVTYRGKSGSQEQMSLESESREAVFKELAQRGLTAIRVEQANGKVKPRKASPKAGNKPSGIVKGALAGVVVVIAALAAWYFLAQKQGPAQPDAKPKKTTKIPEAKPAISSTPVSVLEPSHIVADPTTQVVEVISCQTNAGLGQICEIYRTADGKTHRNYRAANPPIFKHVTDRMLATVLCHDPRVPMPPMPMGIGGADLDKRFMESLKEPIVISPNDSDRDVERKQRVIEAREVVKSLIENGHHFDDIIAEHRTLFNENVHIRNDAMRELNEIHAKGDVEGERKYMININAALQQMGIQELDDPKTPEERRAEREARRLERENRKEDK